MIAKVEPLTTARALRGPFDYAVPGRLGEVDVGSMLVVPFGRQRMLGVVVGLAEQSDVPAERLVEPLTALDPEVPAELVRLGLWVADEYCSTPARGLGLVLPPGTGRGARPRVRARLVLVAELTAAGREALLGGGPSLGERQRAALDALRGGPATAADLSRASGCSHASLRSLAAAGPDRAGEERAGAPAGRLAAGGRAECGGALFVGCPGPRARARLCAGWTRTTTASCSCTASPAAARPRCTCARWPRRSNAGARRSCSCPRSRLRLRQPGASRIALVTPWPCCTPSSAPASATTSGSASGAARLACAWARARRCSRRCRTSA